MNPDELEDFLDPRHSKIAERLSEHAGHEILSISRPLGCGDWGCVYATPAKDVVIKITADKSEARMALYLSNSPSLAFCSFYGACAFTLEEPDMEESVPPAEYGERKIYCIWRENIRPVEGDPITRNESNGLAIRIQQDIRWNYSREDLSSAVNDFVRSSSGKPLRGSGDSVDLQSYVETLDWYAEKSSLFMGLAVGIRSLIEKGVVPTDVRFGNVGFARSRNDQIVCFDPGQTMFARGVKIPIVPTFPVR